MIKLYSALHPAEAHMIRGLLEAEGIESEVRGDFLFGARGELPLTTESAPSVWIREKARFAEARKIVERYERRIRELPDATATWRCPDCDEIHEKQFSHCWRCGHPED